MNAAREKSVSDIREWLVARLSKKLAIPPGEIPADQPMSRLGIDSTEAVVISGELQEWLGKRIAPTVVWDHPTIDDLAAYLAGGAD